MDDLNTEDFKHYFYQQAQSGQSWQSLSPIAKYLNTLKANQRFLLLSSILCDRYYPFFHYQRVAAGLMIKLDAGCPIPLRECIKLVTDYVYASDQEYAFFLAHKFGQEEVLAELQKLQQDESLTEEQQKSLDKLSYWVGSYSLSRYRLLKQTWNSRIRG